MKKLIPFLCIPVLLSFYSNDPPSKFYVKDAAHVHTSAFGDDTAIYMVSYGFNLFDFKGESKTYQVFYDKKFTTLAVEIVADRKNKTQHYRRFARNGQLLMEYHKAGNNYTGVVSRFFYTGKPRSKEYYDKAGNALGDTIWDKAGVITLIHHMYANNQSKTQHFYHSGALRSEIFEGSWQAKTRFIIDYDSLSQQQRYYLCRDTSITTSLEDGSEVTTLLFRKTPIDSVIVTKK